MRKSIIVDELNVWENNWKFDKRGRSGTTCCVRYNRTERGRGGKRDYKDFMLVIEGLSILFE